MRNYAGGIASGKVVALDSPYGGHPSSAAVKINHDGSIIVASLPSDGRKDYHGGRNNFAPIDLLNDVPALADRIHRIFPVATF